MAFADFIGKRIKTVHAPYTHRSAEAALKHVLSGMLADVFGHPVACLCAFDQIKVTTSKSGVAVSGTVIRCEADCG